ncbi:CBN-RIC-4 protein [Caenorhabditis brenneri]|uniref:Synaptosomal-associated protein n=1 Tax=Caenorhabditis brenneri TaxID=135651 RepID=G0N910_CAEBE|nr:CBN-RIC-4 protein [Caenorhabditis brenneri]
MSARRGAPSGQRHPRPYAVEPTVDINGLVLPADMSDELKGLNVGIDEKTIESLESTRRMLALCEESKEAGIKTLVMLDDQGGKESRMAHNGNLGALDTINQDMKEAEDHLKGMEKCCGLCVLPWNKTDDFEKNSEYAKAWKKDDDGGVISDQPRITVGDPTMGPQGGYITKITNDAREEEMDENIQQVSTMVGNLRNMAIDMSTEVSNQNRQLDRIHDKVSNDTLVVYSNCRDEQEYIRFFFSRSINRNFKHQLFSGPIQRGPCGVRQQTCKESHHKINVLNSIEQSVRIFMGTSGVISLVINCFGIYLICYHHGMMDDYRYYLLYFQTVLLLFDFYFSILMVPIPLFPIVGGYSIGLLYQIFGISTHIQMIFTLWCVGNTNTCIFISLLKRHQVVAAMEQKYSAIASWMAEIPGIAVYDIDISLNPSFFFLTFGIMFGTITLFSSYAILYTQLYIMLKSIKSKISIKTFKKHSIAVVSTIMQNLVFVLFFVSPIFLLAVVIYSGQDASAVCIIMVGVISFHSSVNTLVMCFTFPSFRHAILTLPCRLCKNQSRSITIVPPVNNISVTVQRGKMPVQ